MKSWRILAVCLILVLSTLALLGCDVNRGTPTAQPPSPPPTQLVSPLPTQPVSPLAAQPASVLPTPTAVFTPLETVLALAPTPATTVVPCT